VIIPASVCDFHGAAVGATLIYLAVIIGETVWDTKDPCEKYRGVGE
jgi:hypothetical protein